MGPSPMQSGWSARQAATKWGVHCVPIVRGVRYAETSTYSTWLLSEEMVGRVSISLGLAEIYTYSHPLTS